MTDAERAALLAALMDDGKTEFQAHREVERVAADLEQMRYDARFKPVFCLSGKAKDVMASVVAYRLQFGR